MFKSAVYQGNSLLGEAEMYPQSTNNANWSKEIRISHLSPPSDRCPPLAILHTIANAGISFKMESKTAQSDESPLYLLHATCLRENKTAVVSRGEIELHLVAMPSRKSFKKYSCFWGFNVTTGLYNSCLVMLNLRCLGIVFDLDETLIVANTMRSFEDRIDALQRKINSEIDPLRVSGMLAEVKRYQDDKSILKQYVENDQVIENGKVYNVQSEIVPPFSGGQQPIFRPIIRLQERNIILTRINPAIRDTSVLVRLRPAWEDLRNYLTAKGRKRFEVYVCTMAERDYALEMWRLLDPEFNLINANQFLDRIVCVKSGSKKSLLNVFHNGMCHPKMALVIDDRLKVWDDKDQPRVHVVPAFAPYYAPQAETNGAVPVLCVARNVACNVRGSYFKEFDEGLLSSVSGIFFEDDISLFPSAPDVGNYLLPEDDAISNGNKDTIAFDGMVDAEVGRRLSVQVLPQPANNFDPRLIAPTLDAPVAPSDVVSVAAPPSAMSLQNQFSQNSVPVKPLSHSGLSEPNIQGSPAREEGEVPESELDPDTRRRLLILQHGQDSREQCNIDPPLTARPAQDPVSQPLPSHGSWFPLDEEISSRQMNRVPKGYLMESELLNFDRKRNIQSFFQGSENYGHSDRGFYEGSKFSKFPKKAYNNDDRFRTNHSSANYESFQGDEMPSYISSGSRNAQFEPVRAQYPESSVCVLEEIAMKCGAKVEYKTALVDTTALQFTIEVWLVGEKIGQGIGKTRRDAQRQAVDCSLKALAEKYLYNSVTEPTFAHGDLNNLSHANENGFVGSSIFLGCSTTSKGDNLAIASTSDQSLFVDYNKMPSNSVYALKELCSLEGRNLVFKDQPSICADTTNEGEVYAQVEISGQILGKGAGTTWEEAKKRASEEALANLKPLAGQYSQKHVNSLRPYQAAPNKQFKSDFPRALSRPTSASRYSKKDTLVP